MSCAKNQTKYSLIVVLFFITLIFAGCTPLFNSDSSNEPKLGLYLSDNENIPLIAYFGIEETNSSPITVRVKGKTEDMDIAYTYKSGYGKKLPIYGLYPNYKNTIEITHNGETKAYTLTTPKLSEEIPTVDVTINELPETPDPFNQDLYWVGYNAPNNTVAYDKNGDIRYVQLADFAKVLYNSEKETMMFYQINEGTIKTLSGETLFTVKDGIEHHHDMVSLPNNRYAILSDSTWGGEDRVIEQDAGGTITKDVTFASLFRDIVDVPTNPDRTQDMEYLNKIIYDDQNIYITDDEKEVSSDWAHANSLVYDKDKDIMYFSLRHQALIAVDYSEWKLLWWMADNSLRTIFVYQHATDSSGDVINFSKIKALEPYRVNDEGATDGPKNQHALFLHKNGNIGMFDNQGDRVSSTDGSRYAEYQVEGDHGNYTATKVREYHKTGSGFYSQIRSDVDFTAEDNLLMLWGNVTSGSRLREIDDTTLAAQTTEDTKTLFELRCSTRNAYRAEKMPLYPYADTTRAYAVDSDYFYQL